MLVAGSRKESCGSVAGRSASNEVEERRQLMKWEVGVRSRHSSSVSGERCCFLLLSPESQQSRAHSRAAVESAE